MSNNNHSSSPSSTTIALSTTDNNNSRVINDRVTLWVPLAVVVALTFFLTVLIICGHKVRRICFKQWRTERAPPADPHNVQMTLTVPNARSSVPETPPPAYASLERQFSYVSRISQNSSQIEVPPEYDDASETSSIVLPSHKKVVVSDPRGDPRQFSRSISANEAMPTCRHVDRTQSDLQLSTTVFDPDEIILAAWTETHTGEFGTSSTYRAHIPDIVRETSKEEEEIRVQEEINLNNEGVQSNSTSLKMSDVVFVISDDSHSASLDDTFDNEMSTIQIASNFNSSTLTLTESDNIESSRV